MKKRENVNAIKINELINSYLRKNGVLLDNPEK